MSLPPPSSAGVDALVAVDEVVAAAAQERVGPVAADERVVAGAALDRQGLGDQAADDANLVVAGAGDDVDRGEGAAVDVKSDVPSMPTSTWSVPGEPPRNVSRSLSLAPLPAIVSVPAFTLTVYAASAWSAP